jgi:histidinol dehydrogenase
MAKAFSSVSVRDFMKCSAIISADKKGLATVMQHAIALADYEGFYTHAQALRLRQK